MSHVHLAFPQVLGRSEFKLLLKWRLELKKALKAELDGGEREDGKEKVTKAAAGESKYHRFKPQWGRLA